jgi:hypothetical protein
MPAATRLGKPEVLSLPIAADRFAVDPRKRVADTVNGLQLVGVVLAACILWFYWNGLLFHHLRTVNAAAFGSMLAAAAWALHRWRLPAASDFDFNAKAVAVVVAILAAFVLPMLLEPLTAWDARSIWFFHGKRIFFDGGLNSSRGWSNPEYGVFHSSYPKLLPMLAAEMAQVAGFWNEYIPKGGVFVLLVPVVLAIVSATRAGWMSAALLAVLLLLTPGDLMWDGYADGYLATYTAVGLLFLARWLGELRRIDAVSAIIYLGVVLNLKNEGAFVALCSGASLLVIAAATRNVGAILALRKDRLVLLAAALPVATYLTWWFVRTRWGLHDDLLGGDSLSRIPARLNAADMGLIARALLPVHFLWVLAMLIAAVCIALGFRTRLSLVRHALPVLVGILYAAGIFIVYLTTPYDLAWHLRTSADRVMLVPTLAATVTAYLILADVGLSGQVAQAER